MSALFALPSRSQERTPLPVATSSTTAFTVARMVNRRVMKEMSGPVNGKLRNLSLTPRLSLRNLDPGATGDDEEHRVQASHCASFVAAPHGRASVGGTD